MSDTVCVECGKAPPVVYGKGPDTGGWIDIAGEWFCPLCAAGGPEPEPEPARVVVPKPVLTPAQVRFQDQWGVFMDPGAARVVAGGFEDLFRMSDEGVMSIRAVCRSCRVEDWLPLDPVDGGGAPEHRNYVSPYAVRLLRMYCCERCSAAEDAALERANASQLVGVRLKESGMPAAMAAAVSWDTMLEEGATPDDSHKRIRAIEAAKRWAEKEHPAHALLFYGDAGTGKTRLAATAARARLNHSPVRWISVAVLMAELTAAWSDGDRLAALKVLTGKGPVVLDDLDKINPTPNVLAQLFAALDKRDQAGQKAIIFTTNKKPSELAGMLGDMHMSRIAGLCGSTGMMPFPGPDRRLKIGET